jgi:hypothetical protein
MRLSDKEMNCRKASTPWTRNGGARDAVRFINTYQLRGNEKYLEQIY